MLRGLAVLVEQQGWWVELGLRTSKFWRKALARRIQDSPRARSLTRPKVAGARSLPSTSSVSIREQMMLLYQVEFTGGVLM